MLTQRFDALWNDQPAAQACYVSKLVVAPDQRGRGLGEQMLAKCEALAVSRGCNTLRLDCVASNRSLANYYQQRGYYPRGEAILAGVQLLRHDKRVDIVPPWLRAPFVADTWATLLFIVAGQSMLLIQKKRGHGAGKINGPGGKVEPGETPLACAVRETREEIGVDVDTATPLAELRFWDLDGSRMHGIAFKTSAWRGTPGESPEAEPFWCAAADLPYHAMWEDDVLWLPWLLADVPISGDFLMGGERLLAHRLVTTSPAELSRAANTIRSRTIG